MAKAPLVTQFKQYEWIAASPSVPRHKQRLMIVLHGLGDSLKAFRSVKDELNLPEMNYLLLNAPRKYNRGYSWYTLEPRHERGILNSRAKLIGLMKELNEQGWPSDQIFFYGLSQGCLISIDFAMFSGFKLAGVVGISGYVQFWKNWRRSIAKVALETPFIVTHGVFDKVIPMLETREQVQTLKETGFNVVWREFNKAHETDDEFEAPFIRQWVRAQINRSAAKSDRPTLAQTVTKSVLKFLLGNRGQSQKVSGKAARH